MADPFDEIFQALRIKAVVYYADHFHAPWAMRFADVPFARFHFVLEGACHAQIGDETIALKENDLLLLPTGAMHLMSDGQSRDVRDAREVGAEIRERRRPVRHDEPDVRLVSGHIEFDHEARALLLHHMPNVIRAAARGDAHRGLVDALPTILAAEIVASRPGSETIVGRLAEVFLVQIIRAHFEQADSRSGMFSACFDARLNAAMKLMQSRWNEPLTLAQIAAAAGMSRSSFAQKFKASTQISPMSHLANWRLFKARELLADRALSVAQVASACGHRSTEGFSRAFKRAYGASPAAWRAAQAAPASP